METKSTKKSIEITSKYSGKKHLLEVWCFVGASGKFYVKGIPEKDTYTVYDSIGDYQYMKSLPIAFVKENEIEDDEPDVNIFEGHIMDIFIYPLSEENNGTEVAFKVSLEGSLMDSDEDLNSIFTTMNMTELIGRHKKDSDFKGLIKSIRKISAKRRLDKISELEAQIKDELEIRSLELTAYFDKADSATLIPREEQLAFIKSHDEESGLKLTYKTIIKND